MNLSNIYKVLFLGLTFASLIILSSCEGFLEPEPTEFFSEEGAFESIEDADKALLGAYAALDSHMKVYVSLEAILSDDTKITSENTGVSVSLHNWLYSSTDSDVDGLMRIPYIMIYRANVILAGLESVPTGTETEKNQIRGEALALRALAHFDMMRAFGDNYATASEYGIPYADVIEVAEPARENVQDAYNAIMADLTAALPLMTRVYSDDITRFSPEACKAIMAKVALYMEDYAKAKEYATDAINASGLTLATSSNYTGMYSSDELSGEYLFRAGVTSDGIAVADKWYSYQPPSVTNQFAPTSDLLALAGANDIRSQVLSGSLGGDIIINKYPGLPDGGLEGISDIPIIRLSELYLIRAEASYRLNDESDARNNLDQIRTARISGYTSLGETGQNLLNAIMNERRVELAYEGHRFFDLKRWGAAIDRADCPSANNCVLNAGDYHFVLPIPGHEMDANRNMVQYPNY